MKDELAKVDDTVLALLAFFSFDERFSWKGYDFGVMGRLFENGFIENPVNKNKSVVLTDAGRARGRELAERLFAK